MAKKISNTYTVTATAENPGLKIHVKWLNFGLKVRKLVSNLKDVLEGSNPT